MKLIFGDEFIFYTSSMYEICLHCHWLGFSSFILNFGQCDGRTGGVQGNPVMRAGVMNDVSCSLFLW